jgi:hypothetical protein
VHVPSFLKTDANQTVSTIMICIGANYEKFNIMFKEIFSLFCDVLVLNMLYTTFITFQNESRFIISLCVCVPTNNF